MKYAIVIMDGAAGYPLECLDNKTSLEYAKTPNIDKLAAEGQVGLIANVPAGMEPSSNNACMSIMGYSPSYFPIGRGAIEAASLGIKLGPGEVALRMNLCCVQDGLMKSYSCDNISTEASHALADELIAQLNDDCFQIHKGVGFRHILVVKNHPELFELGYFAAHNITDKPVAPCGPYVPDGADDSRKESLEAAVRMLNDYIARANAILAESPINAQRVEAGLMPATNAWVFWPGVRPKDMISWSTCYGHDAAMLSPVDLLNGLAELTGVKRYSCEGMTDGPDNDYVAQGEAAVEILKENDLVFVHVESPDTAGHDGDAFAKVAAIEAIDREIIARLMEYQKHVWEGMRILILPDHPTPVAKKTHSNEPVPYVLAGREVLCSGGVRLTEAEGAKGDYVFSPGCDMMSQFIVSMGEY